MACEMQLQTVGLLQEPESTEWLEAEVPLALRQRRAWSAGDIWDLRKACEDDVVSCQDCTSPVASTSSTCAKFIDDSATASTCDDCDVSSISGDSSIMDWAEEMQAFEAPKSWESPPGVWATPFAMPPGQWARPSTPVNCGLVHVNSPKDDLVKSVKTLQKSNPEAWFKYTAEYGENTRDPRKHTVRFLEDFLRQYSSGIMKN